LIRRQKREIRSENAKRKSEKGAAGFAGAADPPLSLALDAQVAVPSPEGSFGLIIMAKKFFKNKKK